MIKLARLARYSTALFIDNIYPRAGRYRTRKGERYTATQPQRLTRAPAAALLCLHNKKQNKMKNPQNGEWYLLAIKGDTYFITVTRSPRGVVRAWHGYSDKVLATAGGYGYDKESQVLAYACGDFMRADDGSAGDAASKVYNTAAAGIESTKRAIEAAGGKLYDRHEALALIHDDIKTKCY